MTRGSGSTTEALASEVWRRLFGFLIETAAQRNQVLARHELTPNDSRALFGLDARDGRAMSSLATEWGCDASYATSIIDRLERRGLARRASREGDRRVKLVLLTPEGTRLRKVLQRELYRPPPELLRLTAEELEALLAATEKLRADPG
jgi:DNA-binding MarR family transcriptional regulator